jgi:hypothetical protein
MVMVDASLSDLLAPDFVDSLELLSIGELRSRRIRAAEVEVGLSFARRLVQGHLDILLAESDHRKAGTAPIDPSTMVERLPSILADRVHTPGNGRLVTLLAPARSDHQHLNRVDAIVEAARLVDLPSLDDAGLSDSKEALYGLERDVSRERRALHEVMDRLQQELIRRYKVGEVTVDSLLQ